MSLKKSSEILEFALERLGNTRPCLAFICLAVQAYKENPEKVKELTNLIRDRLEGEFTYRGWVKKTHPGIYDLSVSKDTLVEDAYKGRVTWVKSLIEEFKAKGD
jgi:hypothetical protein